MIPKDYQCEGQLTLWDLEPKEELPTLDEVIEIVKAKFDLFLVPIVKDCVKHGFEYECRWKHSTLNIYQSNYTENTNNGRRFISVSWDMKLGGFAVPCDTLDEILREVGCAVKEAEKLEESKRKEKESKKR